MADPQSHSITMPQLGETVTEGTITRWFKKVGDQVAEDEPLFEVSTDKVDSEVPASTGGYLSEILVAEGETVDVGAPLAVIADAPPSGGSNGSAAPVAEPAEAAAAEAEPRGGEPPAEADPDATAPRVTADGRPAPDGRPTPEPARAPAGSEEAPKRQVLSPLVRRLLAENDLDASQIAGTGVDGRVTRNDVMSHLDRAGGPVAPTPAPRQAPAARPPTVTATPAAAAVARTGDDEVIPFSNIRRRTAEHMVRSQATSAHVLTAVEVDFEAVDRVRRAHRESFKAEEGFSLTYLPFVSRAVIDAIRDFPHVNASVGDNELIVHRRIHLGIAVDINFEGLIVPVIHDGDGKRLRSIAREIADLAAKARSKKLSADEISGSTFTITNPGGYGTMITAPVINQPQVAIISTDGVKKRPVVVEQPDGSDAIAIHPVGTLALSFDHRAFDGAYASAFLARVRDNIETRDWFPEL
ncbi:MAG: 2-oxo acid dehydrogenase subunit E2 [Actinomycetota bacterium]|nr:2-oxo acid dehydrogenase subunit E2 [Actinomycetota bacterium]